MSTFYLKKGSSAQLVNHIQAREGDQLWLAEFTALKMLRGGSYIDDEVLGTWIGNISDVFRKIEEEWMPPLWEGLRTSTDFGLFNHEREKRETRWKIWEPKIKDLCIDLNWQVGSMASASYYVRLKRVRDDKFENI